MKILAFSDIHRDLRAAAAIVAAAADADLVIGAGDFATRHQGLEEMMAALAPLAPKALYIPGNNETEGDLRAATTAQVLHGTSTSIAGVAFAGIGCAVPPLPAAPWASYDMTEAQAGAMLDRMAGAEVLITHSPPFGVVDGHADLGALGSRAVHAWIERHQPKLVLCGHIHDAWGQIGGIGASQVRNLGPGITWIEI